MTEIKDRDVPGILKEIPGSFLGCSMKRKRRKEKNNNLGNYVPQLKRVSTGVKGTELPERIITQRRATVLGQELMQGTATYMISISER